MLRIGIIGVGNMGADHARTLQRDVPFAEVVQVCDVSLERAAFVAGGIPGATAVEGADALIDSPDVDAVVVASSDDTHAGYVLACLAAGKPVMCEKPLAPTSAACEDIVAAEDEVVGEGNRLVSVGFMRRFDPAYLELRQLVVDGALGVPLIVHSIGRNVSAPIGTSEFTVTGSAIHDLDIVPWLLGSPAVEVAWLAPRQSPDVTDRQDPQLMLVRTADGVLSTIEVFVNARYGYDTRCEIVGSRSSASMAEPHRVLLDEGLRHGYAYAPDWRPRFADSYRIQLREWVRAVSTGTPSPLATARDGLQAARVAEACVASMHAGGVFVPVAG